MRLDRADAPSLIAIALGSLVGLIGTGIVVERVDDAFDDDVPFERLLDNGIRIDAPMVRPTIAVTRDRQRIRVRVDGAPAIGAPRRPDIYIDGVRIDAELMSIEDLDPTDVESVQVLKGPGRAGAGEIRVRLRDR